MVFMPRRNTPSAEGRADGRLLIAARAAVLTPMLAGILLAVLAGVLDGGSGALAWTERVLICAGTAVLLTTLGTAAVRRVGDGELEVTAVLGSVVLLIAAYFTGPLALLAVPAVSLAAGVVSAVRQDRAERRRKRARRDRQEAAREHFAAKKAAKAEKAARAEGAAKAQPAARQQRTQAAGPGGGRGTAKGDRRG